MMKLRALSVIGLMACAAGCGASSSEDAAGGLGGAGGGPGLTNFGVEPAEDGPEADSASDASKLGPASCVSDLPLEQVELSLGDIQGAASAARAREVLLRSPAESPWPSRIRVSDFLNYYRASADAPATEASITLQARPRMLYSDVGQSTQATGQWDVVVALHAPVANVRKQHALIAIVDTTPSMAGVGIGRAKAVLSALINSAAAGDHLVVLTTDPEQGNPIELDLVGAAEREQAARAVGELELGGESAITEAIARAYDLAEIKQSLGMRARVMLVSDGGGDVAGLDDGRLTTGSQPGENPIALTAVGTGSSSWYRSTLLRRAAELGRGPYVYVDSEDEAKSLFGPRLPEMTEIALDGLSIQLEVSSFYTVHEAGEGIPSGSSPPQYLAPGASTTKLFRLVPCKFGATPSDTTIAVTATHSGGTVGWTGDLLELKKQPAAAMLDKALAIDAYASALRAREGTRLAAAQTLIAAALKVGPDPDLSEMKELVARHPLLNP
jgi:Ca-activated chloride channel family protein